MWRMMTLPLTSLFLLASLLMTCCEAGDYADLEATGFTCQWRASCASPGMQVDFANRSCECDRFCGTFGDCCIDSPHSGPFRNEMRRCMPYGADQETGAYVISGCPSDRSDSDNCLRPNMSDPLLTSPVTEPGGPTYLNAYCAACNDADLARLVRWPLRLACESLAHLDLGRDFIWNGIEWNGREWGVMYQKQFHLCKVLFHKPESVTNVRSCRAGLVSSCPEEGPPRDHAVQCESYEAVVRSISNLVLYRNPHCAICNDMDPNDLNCDLDEAFMSKNKFSYSLMFDFDTTKGNQVGQQSCSGGTTYDQFTKTCRDLVCSIPEYRLVGNRCVKDDGA